MQKILLSICAFVLYIQATGQDIRKIRECIIEKGVLKEVDVNYNTQTAEKTLVFNGVLTNYNNLEKSKDYAANQSWYINNDPVVLNGHNYVKYGLPRILGVFEIEKSVAYKGLGIYREAGTTGLAEIIYIPVRPGCEFQPYQRTVTLCGKVNITPSIKKIRAGKTLTFTANVKGTTEKLAFEWVASSGRIIGDAKKKTVTVSTINVEGSVELELYIKGKTCESYEMVKVDLVGYKSDGD